HLERAALGEIKLDRVSVVDDRVQPSGPIEFERRLPAADGRGDVDWRLLVAERGRPVCFIEAAPFVWPGRAVIAPVAFCGPYRRGAQRTQRKAAENLQRLATMHDGPLRSCSNAVSLRPVRVLPAAPYTASWRIWRR